MINIGYDKYISLSIYDNIAIMTTYRLQKCIRCDIASAYWAKIGMCRRSTNVWTIAGKHINYNNIIKYDETSAMLPYYSGPM